MIKTLILSDQATKQQLDYCNEYQGYRWDIKPTHLHKIETINIETSGAGELYLKVHCADSITCVRPLLQLKHTDFWGLEQW